MNIVNSSCSERSVTRGKNLLGGSKLLLVLVSCLILASYFPFFRWLAWLWSHDKAYSHGFLIPFITLYLIWINRERLYSLDIKPSVFAGATVIGVSTVLLIIGRAGAIAQVGVVSFMLLLPGVILFLWGRGYLRALAFPLLYLQFSVPWLEPIVDRIHYPFQLISARFAVWFLGALGIPTFMNEIYIFLPNITMEVAKECSGIKFLTSIMAIAIPLAYLTQSSWKRMLAVIISSVGIVVFSNSVRVALAGYLGNAFGGDLLHGPGHIFRGWFVAQFGIIILFVVNWAISKIPQKNKTELSQRWKKQARSRATGWLTRQKATSVKLLAGLLIFFATVTVYIYTIAIPKPVNPKKDLAFFPKVIGEWRGAESSWLQGNKFFLNPDETVSMSYTDSAGCMVNLYVGYYRVQTQDKRLVSMYDKPLYKGATTVETGLVNSGPKKVIHNIIRLGNTPYEIVFWYDFPSGQLTGRINGKVKTITDALIYRRNNGAVVLLGIKHSKSSYFSSVSPVLKDFLRTVAPVLDEYLP